jgi:hypothetical protein
LKSFSVCELSAGGCLVLSKYLVAGERAREREQAGERAPESERERASGSARVRKKGRERERAIK